LFFEFFAKVAMMSFRDHTAGANSIKIALILQVNFTV